MYRKIEDFEKGWTFEAANTRKVLANLSDESLSQPIAEGFNTLGGLAWHLAMALGLMLGQVGLKIDAPARGSAVPAKAQEIADVYDRAASSVAAAVTSGWTDEMLAEEVPIFGQSWPRGLVLSALILHQTHHRGQMTVLMRQAGLPVPGMYGPAKEEMAAFAPAASA
ncbi:MAG TPA: DinB family protein [Longimicrobiaceae bacterium]|jgi:uncharacterized damage-inducible protein DinB|nr:DinB family protein [Longimicrobiaceae bacterium]